MGDPKTPATSTVACPGRTDIRFPYADQLPCDVPAVQTPPTSMFPFQNFGPAEITYYFPIPGSNPTAVFFPNKFGFTKDINVIMFFHGFKWHEWTSIHKFLSGKGKVDRNVNLREDINTAGKNVVLIVPTLGEYPGSCSNPKDVGPFSDGAGGDAFLDTVCKWIGDYVPQYKTNSLVPKPNKIVLAGHSGGGVILSNLVRGMKYPICEVWGFDSMYGQGCKDQTLNRAVVPDWLTAAKVSRPATKYFFHWSTDSPGSNAIELDRLAKKDKLKNVEVSPTPHPSKLSTAEVHYLALTLNFLTRVKNASCF